MITIPEPPAVRFCPPVPVLSPPAPLLEPPPSAYVTALPALIEFDVPGPPAPPVDGVPPEPPPPPGT